MYNFNDNNYIEYVYNNNIIISFKLYEYLK